MRITTSISVSTLAAAALVLSGCRSSEPLDTDTAMSLLKDRNTESIKLTFSASLPRETDDVRVNEAYNRLIDAHILTCTPTAAMGKICQPGPAGDALTQVGSTELGIVAGRWVPSTINSISRSGSSSAVADVRMVFEPAPLYRDFEDAFDQIQLFSGHGTIESKKEGRTVRASYQHAEDGWHLESVD